MTGMLNKPIVGQELYKLNVNNAARNREQKLTKVVVTKVGRKYFYCKDLDGWSLETRYYIDSWEEENGGYSKNYVLYERAKDFEDEKHADEIFSKMRRVFTRYGKCKIPLPALIEIDKILDNYKEEE